MMAGDAGRYQEMPGEAGGSIRKIGGCREMPGNAGRSRRRRGGGGPGDAGGAGRCRRMRGETGGWREVPGDAGRRRRKREGFGECQEMPVLARNCREMPEPGAGCQGTPGCARYNGICQNLPAALPCLVLPCLAWPCLALPWAATPCVTLHSHTMPCLRCPLHAFHSWAKGPWHNRPAVVPGPSGPSVPSACISLLGQRSLAQPTLGCARALWAF